MPNFFRPHVMLVFSYIYLDDKIKLILYSITHPTYPYVVEMATPAAWSVSITDKCTGTQGRRKVQKIGGGGG